MRILAASVVVALVTAGCPLSDGLCSEEPAYGGLGNDEVWLTLKDAKAEAQSAVDAATVVAPAEGAALPPDEVAPTFTWESPLKLAGSGGGPLHRPTRSLLDTVIATAASILVPAAHAHLPPVSSDAYLLDILIPDRACPLSIVTTELSHPLDEQTWSALREAAGQPLTLELTSAYLASGRIAEGPFRAEPVRFQVATP